MAPEPDKPKAGSAPPKKIDAIAQAGKFGAAGATFGLLAAATQNSLAKTNVGILGVFRQARVWVTYPAIATAAMGFVDAAAINLRGKDDHWNKALSSFFAGATVGMMSRRIPMVIGLGSFFAFFGGMFQYTGGRLNGLKSQAEEDLYEWKMAMRRNKRRPLEETIAELGEGRGLRPPGYEERRRERIRQKYGWEIETHPATVDDAS